MDLSLTGYPQAGQPCSQASCIRQFSQRLIGLSKGLPILTCSYLDLSIQSGTFSMKNISSPENYCTDLNWNYLPRLRPASLICRRYNRSENLSIYSLSSWLWSCLAEVRPMYRIWNYICSDLCIPVYLTWSTYLPKWDLFTDLSATFPRASPSSPTIFIYATRDLSIWT